MAETPRTGVSLDVMLEDDPGLAAVQKRLRGLAGAELEELSSAIGEVLLSSTLERFRQQRGPDGKPWKKLKKPRPGGGSTILVDKNQLRNSLHVAQSMIGIGTDAPHAATHQYGDFRRDKLGRKRNIPARPYVGITPDDVDEINALVTDYLGTVGT